MTPAAKFNALLASATVFVMFFAVAYVAPQLKGADIDSPILVSIGALITSAGIYRLLAIAMRGLMERIEFLRSLVLGPYYVHGTWIGWFRGHSGELRYMVEHFTQDLDSLAITGRSYDAAGKEHGYWFSQAVTIDVKRGQLIFTYSFDTTSRSATLTGIHSSLFERKSALKAPDGYAGIAHDLNDQTRIAVHAVKTSSALLPWNEALAKAMKKFKGV